MKNHRLLIDCIYQLSRDRDDLRLLLVGSGSEEGAIRAQVSALGLEETVHLAGQQNDVRPYYWAADIAVQPSMREGQGQVLSEAMAAGLPVVCSDAGGMKEVVVDNQTGFVVKANDLQSLCDALARLASDVQLCDEFGKAGLARARDHLDVSVNARKHMALYESILGRTAEQEVTES
jgi:glycosyltransferase involved in cell wall biosynthesis